MGIYFRGSICSKTLENWYYIRPLVRGKAGKNVEFGFKQSGSCFDGYVFLDRISWDNFNESGELKAQVKAYYRFTGYYRSSITLMIE